MYEKSEKTKENKSRAATDSVTQRKSNRNRNAGIVDDRSSILTQRRDNASQNPCADIAQRAVRYKIFERDENDRPERGEGLTKLGVRHSELSIEKNGLVNGVVDGIPQGMSVSDAYEEEVKRNTSKDSESIFKIDETKFDNRITVRTDPEEGNHFLVGPLRKLTYDKLNGKIQSSANHWVLAGVQRGGKWKKTGYTM